MSEFKHAVLAGRIHERMSFQERAWAVCARAPRGRVATYGQIARALGSPRAARAVGLAMNRNPFAPDVPCHRVVGSDGRLVGFAGGVDRKREMLEAEGVRFIGDRVAPECLLREEQLASPAAREAVAPAG